MRLLTLALLILGLANGHDILKDCGAVTKKSKITTLQETQKNAEALQKCFEMANSGVNDDRTVVVPDGHIFQSMPIELQNITDVTFTIDGVLETAQQLDNWTLDGNQKCKHFIQVSDSTHFNINGKGKVEGNGYDWWVREWNRANHHGRPHLLRFDRVQYSEIQGVAWRNSPNFHMGLNDVDSFYIHDMEIDVDILKQKEIYEGQKEDDSHMREVPSIFKAMLGEYSGLIDFMVGSATPSWPTMPLNTDGIDPSGSNITIRNVNITNWDDAVAVKPAHKYAKVAKDGCAQDILVENVNVKFGVGMTIGSVPPSNDHACIRRVTFRDIKFEYPMKAIYVKTNPGQGTGEIRDILYENIRIHFPIWYNIYIGPQQQKQPDGGGPGCMTYPFGGCETQPLIDISNITLRNIESHGGFLPPGVIRCNSTNPCQDINFDNVHISGWWEQMNWSFISEYAYGSVNDTTPDPRLGKPSERVFNLFSIDNMIAFAIESLKFYQMNETDITAWQVLIGIIFWALKMIA